MIVNRVRNRGILLRVSDEECKLIDERMKEAGIKNRSHYLRKMALEGMIIHYEIPEFNNVTCLLQRLSSNVNQLAKNANERKRIYDVDVSEILEQFQSLIEVIKKIFNQVIQMEKLLSLHFGHK